MLDRWRALLPAATLAFACSSNQAGAGLGDRSCPTIPPEAGATCSAPNRLQCEYGSSPGNATCDTLFACDGDDHWQGYGASGGDACAPMTRSLDCPATMPANGTPCTDAAESCLYGDGPLCYCFAGPAGQVWTCVPSDPRCPIPRPRLGSSCNLTNVGCSYDQTRVTEFCDDGIWQMTTAN